MIATVIYSSFAKHYRRRISQLLNVLKLHSNHDIDPPVIQAIELLKKYAQSPARYYNPDYNPGEDIPIDGVLKSGWKEVLLGKLPHI